MTIRRMRKIITSNTQDESLGKPLKKDPSKKTGLVLSGGGAKSIFQAQVVKRLFNEGYSFDIISGVSAGAVNAAIISQKNKDFVDIWLSARKEDLCTGGFNVWRIFQILTGWKNSIYDTDGFQSFIRRYYKPKNTKIPFIVGNVNLHTGEFNEVEIFPDDDLTGWSREEIYYTILSSASIPFLFTPVPKLGRKSDHLFADGGLRNITPLSSIIRRDVDRIIVITTSPQDLGSTSRNLTNPFFQIERSFDIIMNEILREDIDNLIKINNLIKACGNGETIKVRDKKYRHIEISLIEPRFGLGGMLDFSDSIQKERIEEANLVCNQILQ